MLIHFENILHKLKALDKKIDNLECESIDDIDLMIVQLNNEETEELNNSNITDFLLVETSFLKKSDPN